jgi:hypothetical protein
MRGEEGLIYNRAKLKTRESIMYVTRMCHNYFNVNQERVGFRVLEASFTEPSSCLLILLLSS